MKPIKDLTLIAIVIFLILQVPVFAPGGDGVRGGPSASYVRRECPDLAASEGMQVRQDKLLEEVLRVLCSGCVLWHKVFLSVVQEQ